MPISAVADFSSAGAVVPASFLGISVEYGTGTVGAQLEPLFGAQSVSATANLLNRLAALQGAPVIRIGGASEDAISVLTPQMAGDLASITSLTGSRLIVGINFETATPAVDVQFIKSALGSVGANNIMGFELGNEPNGYYDSYQAYDSAWNSFAQSINTALPQTDGMLVGPAFYGASWVETYTPQFIGSQHAMLSAVTVHNYAYGAGQSNATISNLLSPSASSEYATLIEPSVTAAAAYGIPVRYGEMNSISGGGENGVSNTFAESLWSLDTMFEVASVGAAGVNFHTSSLYGAFVSTGAGDEVLPLYYGMLMFAQAAPPGSQIIPVSFKSDANVKIWMTRDGGVDRIVIINKDLTQNVSVQFHLPYTASGSLELLTAPSASSEFGITIGGLTFNDHNGMPTGTPNLVSVLGDNGLYTVNVNAVSAALLTVDVPEASPLLLVVGALSLALLTRRRTPPSRD
ncbi:MAG: glycosyl hydrolase family protein [Phycisphaerae bacterium]